MNRPSTLRKDSKRKAIWIHASSGEFEHAKSVIRQIKTEDPYERVVVSYSSPSYYDTISKFEGVDEYVPLPVDTSARSLSIIKSINPKVVLFARTDVWPDLVYQLKRKKIPSILFAKVKTKPLNFLEKTFTSFVFNNLSHISFVSKNDSDNLAPLISKQGPSTSIDGDPRYDEVFYRKKALNNKLDISLIKEEKTLIVGSCWDKDYQVIYNPIKKLLSENGLNKVIIAPHEIDETFIEKIRHDFSVFKVGLYSKKEFDSKVLIIDKVGLLFELYSKADIAFVGGSFKSKVHSVLEPLSWGLPTLVGPKHKNSHEAIRYSSDGFKFVIPVTDSKSFHDNIYRNLKQDKKLIAKTLETDSNASLKVLTAVKNLIS